MSPLPSPIVLTGQDRWCAELAVGLQRYAHIEATLATFEGLGSALDPRRWRKIARAKVVLVVGFRPGAQTIRGRVFDWLFTLARGMGPAKTVIYYWIGSEVQRTLADSQGGRLSRRFGRMAAQGEHLAGSRPLAEDLATIGIHAEVADFPWLGMPEDAHPLPMPADFAVLSYVPDARPEFYGGPQLLEVARALPSIRFLVVGGTGSWVASCPDNVRFLGWQEHMEKCYAAVSCVVRMVEYDSVGATIIEALAYGRTAIYSQHLEHTTYVPFGDVARLTESLRELANAYRGESTPPDTESSEWARREYDPARLFGALAKRLNDAAGGLRASSANGADEVAATKGRS